MNYRVTARTTNGRAAGTNGGLASLIVAATHFDHVFVWVAPSALCLCLSFLPCSHSFVPSFPPPSSHSTSLLSIPTRRSRLACILPPFPLQPTLTPKRRPLPLFLLPPLYSFRLPFFKQKKKTPKRVKMKVMQHIHSSSRLGRVHLVGTWPFRGNMCLERNPRSRMRARPCFRKKKPVYNAMQVQFFVFWPKATQSQSQLTHFVILCSLPVLPPCRL